MDKTMVFDLDHKLIHKHLACTTESVLRRQFCSPDNCEPIVKSRKLRLPEILKAEDAKVSFPQIIAFWNQMRQKAPYIIEPRHWWLLRD